MEDLENQTRSPDQEALADFKKSNRPVTVKLDNVVYKIKTKNSSNSKPEERLILKGITGVVLPGEILAMLGPSSSGKTTLLSALGGRLDGHLEGKITYNGKPFSNSMNRNLGFVTQEDTFYPHLTVTETLVFTALLRLPNTLTKQEKIMQAEAVITQLGLTKCKNSIMGDQFLRGVSGGEKKRVSIGQELLINPSVLLLDEPTSGLDSTSAHRIVLMLLELVRGGQTVVMAIHQPSSRLFYMFHKVLLLSDGNPLYFGKGGETMDYFSSIGYAPDVAMNPSDFLLDLANGVYLDKMDVKEALVSAYTRNLASRLKEELQETSNHDQDLNKSNNKGFDQWTTTWIQQFYILLRRDLKERKHDCFSRLKLFHVLVISSLVALVWWKSNISHLQDQTGLLFFYCMYWCVQPFYDAICTFPQLRAMLVKERSSSMYRISSFFMARMMADLPMELIRPTMFVTITYWMESKKDQEMVDSKNNQTQSSEHDEEALSIFKKSMNCSVILKFDDVVYKIRSKKGRSLFYSKKSKPEEKLILKGITGEVLPGEMLAMLGPSGSGKTTLLTALGGRLGGLLEGKITYNGKSFSSSMNRNTGFVTQDDTFYPHLTVTETLVFTALLRLPKTLTTEEKIMQAEVVIAQLGLAKCKNSIVGGPFLRGVSGGERKRVSIGQELLINPSLLLLDEPTSGLDSTSAQRIVLMLLELAKGGRTLVMTIHQPSSRLFYMFHKVLLLSEGNPLYFGKAGETMDYFSSIGYAPSVAMNPSDFLLDLANGVYLDDSEEDIISVKDALVSAYKSNTANRLKDELQETGNHDQFPDGKNNDERLDQWTINWTQQFSILLKRDLKERKHESFSHLKLFQIFCIGFLSGLLWWQSTDSHMQDKVALLFFYSLFWTVFPLMEAIYTFPQVRTMLIKERSSGMYRLSSFFLAKTMADLPIGLLLPTIYMTITYWMVGLKPTATNFFETLFVILYSAIVSQGFGIALGAIVMNTKIAVTLGTVLGQSFILVGGFYLQHLPGIIVWLQYTSCIHYTYKLMLGSQYKSDELLYPCGSNVSCRVGSYPAIEMIGLGNKTVSVVVLGIMLVGCRLIAYVSLMRIGDKHP